jgi:hypothetical protein
LRLIEAKLSVEVKDSDWSFGQILPVFLLIGPIVTAIEAIAPESKSEEGGDASNQDSAEAGGRIADLEAAATPQDLARSSTENAPTQLPGMAAPTAQPEAQANAQQSAGNNTPNASQVSSEQAAYYSTNPPTPQEITQEQLRAQLYAYHSDGRAMRSTAVLACLQVLAATAFLFIGLAFPRTPITRIIVSFLPNVFIVQFLNGFMMVLLGLVPHVDGLVPVVNRGSSKERRRRRWGERLGWGWTTVLFLGADVLHLFGTALGPEPGYALLIYFCVPLFFFCCVAVWYAVQQWAVRQRPKEQGGRADTLPLVADVGHELQAVE